ncbi:hypothetical protein GCM10007962_06880 [Yeosuana aromativorans]|uniref:YbbR-like domain-containing protein n=2 Tax=Yeosuana aromativorans TaxID=288019 RepID=A0A8J3BKC2_9FLAO|nr:hypothetical protein GCM10007962_06880 [Yeosuana aromativorans]
MSLIILIFSKLSKEYTNTIPFKIKKVNVPQEYVILKDSNATINITLKAYGFNWLKYYISNPELTIDFKKDVVKKMSYFVWDKATVFSHSDEYFGSQVTLINVSPNELHFKYDTNLVKTVPVIGQVAINFKPGYDMINPYKIEPDSIDVIGPKALVSKIELVKTDSIVLNNVNSDISRLVQLKKPSDNKGVIYSKNQVNIKGRVERFTEGTLKVPINIINVPKDIKVKYFPKEINVVYYTSLKSYSDISAKDFKVICDFNHVSNNQSFLLPELIKITDKVKTAKINQQHIEFIIEE